MSNVELASFLQEVEVAGVPICPIYQAYKMDSTVEGSNMRQSVGLGQCNCCDYFIFGSQTLVLIEETQLRLQIKNLWREFSRDISTDIAELNEQDQRRVERRILAYLSQENKLKVYGSLLVLWRLAAVVDDRAEALRGSASYWLVASGESNGDDIIYFDNLKPRLENNLHSALTGNVVSDVKIVPAEQLGERLPPVPTVT